MFTSKHTQLFCVIDKHFIYTHVSLSLCLNVPGYLGHGIAGQKEKKAIKILINVVKLLFKAVVYERTIFPYSWHHLILPDIKNFAKVNEVFICISLITSQVEHTFPRIY